MLWWPVPFANTLRVVQPHDISKTADLFKQTRIGDFATCQLQASNVDVQQASVCMAEVPFMLDDEFAAFTKYRPVRPVREEVVCGACKVLGFLCWCINPLTVVMNSTADLFCDLLLISPTHDSYECSSSSADLAVLLLHQDCSQHELQLRHMHFLTHT